MGFGSQSQPSGKAMQVHLEVRRAEAVEGKRAPTASSTGISKDKAIFKARRKRPEHWMGGVAK